MFNLKKTRIFKAVAWERNPFFSLASILRKFFSFLFYITLSFFLYGFVLENFSEVLNRKLLGFSIIFLTFSVFFWLREYFLNLKLKKPKLKVGFEEMFLKPEEYNLAELLSFESAKAVYKSINFVKSKRIPEIDSSVFLYFLLSGNPDIDFVFSRGLISRKRILKRLKQNLKDKALIAKRKKSVKTKNIFGNDFENIILESLKVAKRKKHQRIEVLDALCALAKKDLIFKEFLVNRNLKAEDVENLSSWLESLKNKWDERKAFWKSTNLFKKGSLGREWTISYTVTLDKFSTNLTKATKKQGFPETVGHYGKVEEIERILSKREDNNALLVAEPGSGRKSIIQGLIRKSVLRAGIPDINDKRVMQLDLPLILSYTETAKETALLIERIFNDVASAGNIILVIDNFHNFIGEANRPGMIDISGILSSYLKLPQFRVIAITNYKGLHERIEQSPIMSLFEKVEVSEISSKETLKILERLTLSLEAKHKRFISYQALRDVVFFCDKYLSDSPFPEKAVELLDEVIIYVKQKRKKVVLSKHVTEVVFGKTKIPVGEVEAEEKKKLLNLEDLIHERIINQEEAVKEVSSALRRARSEITIKKGPMGTFLFLGPTGVGKTETAKALAEIYFHSENRIIRLDMSEFQNPSDIARLIGSSKEEGLLTVPVKDNPFSLILLDEIEKCHPSILNLFLQILDEGYVTDGLGRKINFKNTIIIATSNAGSVMILEAVAERKKMSEIKDKFLNFLFESDLFQPEFINRFDAVVLFKVLTRQNLLDIADLLLRKLKKNLSRKDIELIITRALKEKIVEIGYDPRFGAREMKRTIQNKIENILARAVLGQEIKGGDRVEINPQNFELNINP